MRRLLSDRGERGAMAPFVIIVALGILLVAGLVIDGGRQLNGHGRAVAYAQEAARAGAQAIQTTDPMLAELRVGDAVVAAQSYCRKAKAQDPELVACTASVITLTDSGSTHDAVKVTARVEVASYLLGMIGFDSLGGTGSALARPVSGIMSADDSDRSTQKPPVVASPPPPTGSAPGTAPTAEPPSTVACPSVTKTLPPEKPKGKNGKNGKGGKKGKPPRPPKPSTTVVESCPPINGR